MDQELEKTLWATADKLRNNMDAAEYKHIVLGLIFLKYISDSFEQLYDKLKEDKLSDPEDKDEYLAENVFYVPPTARWSYLQHQRAKLPTIGKDIDDAMDAIEKDNPSLKGVLPKDYARPSLDKKRLGELVDLIGKEKNYIVADLKRRFEEAILQYPYVLDIVDFEIETVDTETIQVVFKIMTTYGELTIEKGVGIDEFKNI